MNKLSQHAVYTRSISHPSPLDSSATSASIQRVPDIETVAGATRHRIFRFWNTISTRGRPRKGFGLYSPHETTISLLKLLLVSFWTGIDAALAFQLLTTPSVAIGQHVLLPITVITTATTGTVFSLFLAWSIGADFGKSTPKNTLASRLKSDPRLLSGAALVTAIALSVALSTTLLRFQKSAMAQAGMTTIHAKPEDSLIWKQCIEVARLEQMLFQSNERTAMAACLLQYDVRYAPRPASQNP